MIISLNNRGRDETKMSSLHIYNFPNENRSPPDDLSSTASLFLNALLSKTGLLVPRISLFLGLEAGRSAGSFCLAIVSFLGGSRNSQEETPMVILVFLGGFFFVGYNQATVVTVLLSWLVAYACQLRVKDVVFMTLAYGFGIMGNISNHVFFLVVLSYLGGKTVQYDQGMIVYMGLSILVASMGKMNEAFPLYMV